MARHDTDQRGRASRDGHPAAPVRDDVRSACVDVNGLRS